MIEQQTESDFLMSLQENKALVLRMYEAINSGDFEALRELVHDDFVGHEGSLG